MKNKINIIGITGEARHGKDTFGDKFIEYLDDSLTLRSTTFAKKLKSKVMQLLDIQDIEVLDYHKNSNIPYYGVNVRLLLQQLADDMKKIDDMIFVKAVEDEINEAVADGIDIFIVKDLRFNYERDFLKKYDNLDNAETTLIKIYRPNIKPIEGSLHSSERDIKNMKVDKTIINSNTLEKLHEKSYIVAKEFNHKLTK